MNLVLIDTNEALLELYPRLMSADWVAIDTETTGLDTMRDLACGLCLAIDEETGYYVAFGHVTDEPQCSTAVVSFVVETLLRNPRVTKVFHNSKYDRHILLNSFGVSAVPPFHDTMVMGFIVDNTVRKGLKPWCERLFGSHLPQLKEDLEAVKGSRRIPTYAHFHPSEIADYGAADAVFTFKLAKALLPMVEKNQQLPLYHMEMELVDFVLEMERNGVLIDKDFLEIAGKGLDDRLPDALEELHAEAGWAINPGSHPQVRKLLFEQLKMPVLHYTAGGRPSTAEGVLLNLPAHPVIPLILECRTLRKIKSTYVEGILDLLNPSGRLHCRFNQLGAETGRFSSSRPNLQNIPREGSVPVSIRGAFIPTPGHIMVFIDYSQVEMRLFAHYSGDPGLIQLVHDGYDFHQATGAEVFHVGIDEVTKQQRKFAKQVNFGYVYGIGAAKLARELQISIREAKAFLRRYNQRFPAVPIFMEQEKAKFNHRGYVENLFGRRRFIPWDKAYRAVNTLIQGSAADVIKYAMIRLKPLLRSINTYQIMTIHDEIVFEVPFDEVWVVPEIQREMERFKLHVPIEADIEWADTRWGDKKSWETFDPSLLPA